MAKGHSKGGSAHVSTLSLTTLLAPTPIAPTPLVSPATYALVAKQAALEALSVDRRRYAPDKSTRPPPAARNKAVRLRHYDNSYRLGFHIPNMIGLCLRRQARKEVLHALKKTRKGAGSSRRRNFWSDIKC